jgi:hypothetical protein
MTALGLTFTDRDLETAQQQRANSPYKAAFSALEALEGATPAAQAVIGGFRVRYLGAPATPAAFDGAMLAAAVKDTASYVDQCAALLAYAQAFQLQREGLPPEVRQAWLTAFASQLDAVRQGIGATPSLLDVIWRGVAEAAASVILDQPDLLDSATRDYTRVIGEEIHPEGYMPALVNHSSGGALFRQMMAAKGLVLTAEIASHAGRDLWNVQSRGITARTAAIYAAAYYDYAKSWKWDAPLNPEDTERLYKTHGAFLEILNRQLNPALLKATLDVLRPLFDPYGGGLTTLSHGQVQQRGWFRVGR